MSDESPGRGERLHGRAGRGLGSSVGGNSPAFGFSVMITGSLAMMSSLAGTPDVDDVLLFAVAAAAAVGVLEGIVSRGFRASVPRVPREVTLLATSMNVASVAVGIGAVLGVGETIGDGVGWPVAGFAGATAYVLAEAAEVVVAEAIQRARGDPDAGTARDER